MSENHTHTERLLTLAKYLADHPAATAIIIMIDDAFLDRTRTADPRVVRPDEIPVDVPPFGSIAETLAIIRTLRSMSFIRTVGGGFALENIPAQIVASLRLVLERDLDNLKLNEFCDVVLEQLRKKNSLPPDPHSKAHTNRIWIRQGIGALAPFLVVNDAVAWLTRSRNEFGGETPLMILARGEVDRVLAHIADAGLMLYF